MAWKKRFYSFLKSESEREKWYPDDREHALAEHLRMKVKVFRYFWAKRKKRGCIKICFCSQKKKIGNLTWTRGRLFPSESKSSVIFFRTRKKKDVSKFCPKKIGNVTWTRGNMRSPSICFWSCWGAAASIVAVRGSWREKEVENFKGTKNMHWSSSRNRRN